MTHPVRKSAQVALLREIEAMQSDMAKRRQEMINAAIATGCTSLVNTVRGIENALERAHGKVKRSLA